MSDEFWKIGSIVELAPAIGAKRKLKLNRTKYNIRLFGIDNLKLDGFSWTLPQLNEKSGYFTLSLYQEEYYILEASSEEPFYVNGVACLKAIPRSHDEVWIGPNRLDLAPTENIIQKENYFFSEALISSSLPILLEGETGTGKSFMAKKIHQESGLAGDFVQVNLSSFSANLLESELFGHVKGSFSGAMNDKRGAIEMAKNGTLFLDEIDSLSIEIQTKLLIFLDDQEYRPVGSERAIKGNVRFVFASGKPLLEIVEKNYFRKDLFYRITSGKCFTLEPLRINRNILEVQIDTFLNLNHLSISKELRNFYLKLSWPGNIRQLRSHLEKKKTLEKGNHLKFSSLDYEIEDQEVKNIFKDENIISLSKMKYLYTKKIFDQLNGCVSQSAKCLNISPNTLKRILQESA